MLNLANFESMTGNSSAAARYFEQAITLLQTAREDFPLDFDIAWALATMLRDSGDISKARQVADSMAEQFPNNENIEALRRTLPQQR